MSFLKTLAAGWKNTFTGNAKKGQEAQPYHDWGLLIIGSSMLIGTIGMFITSVTMNTGAGWKASLSNLGLSIIISLAAGFCGGFMGFLFGIPRSLQRPDGDPNNLRLYSNNTNLEQISDWLTKIIVGVGLTQIKEIQFHFEKLSSSLARGFIAPSAQQIPFPYTSTLIIYYTICGFIAVYLYSKIYLLKQLSLNEKNVEEILAGQKEIKEKQQEIKAQLEEKIDNATALQREIKITQLKDEVDKYNRQKNRVLGDESSSSFKEYTTIANPKPVTIIDDCQKNRWGGKPIADGFELKADFISSRKANGIYTVRLTVKCNQEPLCKDGSKVFFFLHDSYSPESVVEKELNNGSAYTEVESWQAFTIGAYLVEANIKLELDLNEYIHSPEDYKYTSILKSIDKVDKQISQLEYDFKKT